MKCWFCLFLVTFYCSQSIFSLIIQVKEDSNVTVLFTVHIKNTDIPFACHCFVAQSILNARLLESIFFFSSIKVITDYFYPVLCVMHSAHLQVALLTLVSSWRWGRLSVTILSLDLNNHSMWLTISFTRRKKKKNKIFIY